jgi:transcription factor TFIIIB component B''
MLNVPQALTQFGLDFTLIGYMFPNRSRRQLKNKYKTENSKNPQQVDDALKARNPESLQQYRDIISMLNLELPEHLEA